MEKNIKSPGVFLRELRESRGLSQRGLALKMGISNSTISKIENDERRPKFEILEKYSRALRVDLTYLIAINKGHIINPTIPPLEIAEEEQIRQEDIIEVDMTMKIPLVGTVKAGSPILAIDNIEDYITVDRNRLSKDRIYYALIIKGDSMDKLFPEGTTIVVEKTNSVENNQIAVVGINGYEATVKRVTFAGDNIALIPESNNPAHLPHVLNLPDNDVHILGRVVQAISYF